MAGEFDRIYAQSISDPEEFWSRAAEGVTWSASWDKVFDPSRSPHPRWFSGGRLNTCFNAVDRHVQSGRGDQVAIAYDSPVTDTKRTITYAELLDLTSRFAGVLKTKGVGQGDRVVIYMPMVPEAVVAALACARIGAVHSIVFGGFAAKELAVRIDDAQPKVVVSASCGIEPKRVVPYKPLLDEAIRMADHPPAHCIILQRARQTATLVANRDTAWADEMAVASPVGCTDVEATDPLYILYTSGTTGQPKGVVRDTGGHAVALRWSMKNVYGVEPGEAYWAASDIGWVVGHSYIIYGPLLHGCTSVLYEGKPVGTPDPGAFWRVVSEYGVRVMFTAPTAIRAIRQHDPDGAFLEKYDLSSLRAFFLAGERCDPDTLAWCQTKLGVPVIDHWWQTESGWAMAANCLGIEELPVKPGSPTKPVPGWDVRALGPDGREVSKGDIGAICVKLPLPPSAFPTLWNAEERYRQTYFSQYPGYYLTGDAGYIDEDGYLYVMSRTDDVINVAGHRLSTGAMEEVLASHPDVAECAVIGVSDPMKGELPVGLVVLGAGANRAAAEVSQECVQLVREQIGPVASFRTAAVVERLPKTRSGKILRSTMKKIADGAEYRTPATIEDAAVLGEVESALSRVGYPKKD